MVVDLHPRARQAFEDALDLVEHLVAGQKTLLREVERLKRQLDTKKQAKATLALLTATKRTRITLLKNAANKATRNRGRLATAARSKT